MSFNFASSGPMGPTALSPVNKSVEVLAVKLTNADFTTGGTASVKAVLPKDASIIGFRLWNKTQLAGNGITAATLAIGVQGNATKHIGAANAFSAANTYTFLATSNIMQDANVETSDQRLLFTGTATTGNPTSGEMYVLIEFIR